jgi:hypothetical protein
VASKAVTALPQLVGADMDYWFDVYHVTKGGLIEELGGMKKKRDSFSFHLYVTRYNPVHHSSVWIL